MITTMIPPDGEEMAEAVLILSTHMRLTPLKTLELLMGDGYFDEFDVGQIAPHLKLTFGEVRHLVENL
tara:strand:+ start:1088 stop:1291 length:204 start_codon:yes stop_codon:yes gene_type:complete